MSRLSRTSVGWLAALLLLLAPALVNAEVSRVEITSRRDVLGGRSFDSTGPYEYLVGRVYLSVDPADPHNRIIVDLDKAPKNAAGRVEFSADLAILKPRDPGRGNGVALVDIVNRGSKTVLRYFSRANGAGDLANEEEFGDASLLRQGYTLVWVGWEFDVPRAGGVRIDVPVATGVTGMARATFVPNTRTDKFTVGDLAGYAPSDVAAAGNTLTVRDAREAAPITIAREKWRLAGNTVSLDGGFEPGRTYELAYAAANPPVSGLGFVAVRDTATWVKYAGDAVASARYAFAFGASQSGRFLRTFLYEGFNTDERSRQVFDGVLAHIAGAARIDLNRRWATPTTLAMYTATSFPFADVSQRDPVSGAEEGALENPRARDHRPKIIYTNTGVEYWGGGRVAALTHTTLDGSKDLALADNERSYFLTGSQHGPAAFPPTTTNGQQTNNPNDYSWAMRALLVAMDNWVRKGVTPPASRIPQLADGTLVPAGKVVFPAIPAVASPRNLTAGARARNPLVAKEGAPGSPLPLLVPQVDKDGNELAGIRLPDVAVPLATYTGWNFRNVKIGAPEQLFPLLGSYLPFATEKAERERTHDPRSAIDERYPTRDRYLMLVQEAGAALVKNGYVLAEDLPAIVRHAGEHWDLLVRRANGATARNLSN